MKKLYIGNLPFSATEEQLQEWFAQVGVTPSGVNLIRDRFTGQSRGFAFVEVQSDEDADRAVNSLNGQNFGGRNLVVKPGRRLSAAAGGGGRGGGGGGYGGSRGGMVVGVAVVAEAATAAGAVAAEIVETAVIVGSSLQVPRAASQSLGAPLETS